MGTTLQRVETTAERMAREFERRYTGAYYTRGIGEANHRGNMTTTTIRSDGLCLFSLFVFIVFHFIIFLVWVAFLW